MKKIAFLLLGTNLGDRKKNLSIARNAIEVSVGAILKASPIYQTEAWGKTDQPDEERIRAAGIFHAASASRAVAIRSCAARLEYGF